MVAMPRMTGRSKVCPKPDRNEKPGVWVATSAMLFKPGASMASAEKAVTDKGMLCVVSSRFSSRFFSRFFLALASGHRDDLVGH